jgi:hypothetical protein
MERDQCERLRSLPPRKCSNFADRTGTRYRKLDIPQSSRIAKTATRLVRVCLLVQATRDGPSFAQHGAPSELRHALLLVQNPMLSGKRFKLERATLAVEQVVAKRRTITVSAGEIIEVVADPNSRDGLVEVLWDKRLVQMFAVDVDVRTEITDLSANA